MQTQKQPLHFLSEKERQQLLQKVIDFFATERNEQIGVIAAEEILKVVAATIYNKAILDASQRLRDRFDDVLVDIELLKQSID